MNSQRIYAQKHKQETFYKLYKFLFEDKTFKTLSDSAKIAYSLFRDRFSLSIENNWVDKNGHVYFIFTTKELCEILGCGTQKATKIKKELKDFGLLEQQQIGLNKANRIYILEPVFDQSISSKPDITGNSDNQNSDVSKPNVRNFDNQNSRIVIIKMHKWWKSKSNKTYSIKTYSIKTYNNLNNMYNLKESNDIEKQASHSSNTSNHSQNSFDNISENQYKKEMSFNKYPELMYLQLNRLHYDDAKLLMDILNKAKKAVSKEYADMKNDFDFTYESHESAISNLMNRMILKAKFDNLSINHLSAYISRSIQNYFRNYAEELLQQMIEDDMSSAGFKM